MSDDTGLADYILEAIMDWADDTERGEIYRDRELAEEAAALILKELGETE